MSASTTPRMQVTKLHTPKREYRIKPKKVPGYLVWNRSYVSRLQLAPPKKKKVYAYLRENGFLEEKGDGPGDHEKWRLGNRPVQVNFHGNECDYNSIKAIARILGKRSREVIVEMKTRKRRTDPASS